MVDWYKSDDGWAFVDPARSSEFPSERGEWKREKSVKMEDVDWQRHGIDPEALRDCVRRDGFYIVAKPEGLL